MSVACTSADWSILQLLNWTTEYFKKAGIEDARLNAELLLSEAAGMERIMLYARFEDVASESVRQRYREMVRKRVQRCPIQYIFGKCEFFSRQFKVNPSVLIPRPETEVLVQRCLELLPHGSEGLKIADICTGSGVIAVTMACEMKNLLCHAADISAGAIELAAANASFHGVSDRVFLHKGSLIDALPDGMLLDMVVSNPPYIPSGSLKQLQPEVSSWEPAIAIDGGPDGLAFIEELVSGAPRILKPGGWLILEFGDGQSEAVISLIKSGECWSEDSLEIRKDSAGHERILSVRRMV